MTRGAAPTVESVVATLRARGIELPSGRVRLDSYGDSPELSEKLLNLIRHGNKRAGTALLWAIQADGDRMPEVGDIEIVLDHQNEPALLTRLRQSYVTPFGDVTAAYAAIEAEGDGSLEHWRQGARSCST